ncbi:MAG TPA: restriction endonuclease [Rhizomicrobium sp.]
MEIKKLNWDTSLILNGLGGPSATIGIPNCPDLGLAISPKVKAFLRAQRKYINKGSKCPYCGENIKRVDFAESHGPTILLGAFACSFCGYWSAFNISGVSDLLVAPYAANFAGRTFIPCYSALIDEIGRHPERVHSMEPRAFEIFVGSVLKQFINCSVHHVGRSQDDGVDLVLVEHNEPTLIQVKRREDPHKSEGLSVVKELFATMIGKGAKKGKIVTTATKFSRNALKWLALPRIEESGFEISLMSLDRLLAMTGSVAQGTPRTDWRYGNKIARHAPSPAVRCFMGDVPFDDSAVSSLQQIGKFLVSGSTGGQTFAFAARDQRCCWLLRGPIGNTSMSEPELEEFVREHRRLEGPDFMDVLFGTSEKCSEMLVRFWSMHNKIRLVDCFP